LHPRGVGEEEGGGDVVDQAGVDLRPVEPFRAAAALLGVRELQGELGLGLSPDGLELADAPVVLADDPLDLPRRLALQALPELGDPGRERGVVPGLLGDQRLRRVDAALGESADQRGPVDEVEDVVRPDVFRVLRAVRQLDRGLRGGRRRPLPRPRR
jgi:hypothetical protein